MQKPLFGYVIAALIGAVGFVIVGYFVNKTPDSWSFHYWLTRNPFRPELIGWIVLGCAIGLGLRFVAATR